MATMKNERIDWNNADEKLEERIYSTWKDGTMTREALATRYRTNGTRIKKIIEKVEARHKAKKGTM